MRRLVQERLLFTYSKAGKFGKAVLAIILELNKGQQELAGENDIMKQNRVLADGARSKF